MTERGKVTGERRARHKQVRPDPCERPCCRKCYVRKSPVPNGLVSQSSFNSPESPRALLPRPLNVRSQNKTRTALPAAPIRMFLAQPKPSPPAHTPAWLIQMRRKCQFANWMQRVNSDPLAGNSVAVAISRFPVQNSRETDAVSGQKNFKKG